MAEARMFRQPRIVSRGLDGRPSARAERRLSPDTARRLRAMLRLTGSGGTAAQAVASVGGSDRGAKTGSAEVDGKAAPDSWFTGSRDSTDAAAAVRSGGHATDAVGPLVARMLRAG
ncbi:penicillin-binding transpeptidase domain-containing protein [Streptomyces sp. NPDC050448]|uniref:penicillin-binding transpeptidase domain-containing protein n=1 Tax=Streptomyces sp. NPDC050448 TaxID=3155404 RepID=UPI0034168DA3